MRHLFTILLFSFSLLSISAQPTIYPNEWYTTIYDFEIDGMDMFAVGNCKVISISRDGGLTNSFFEYDDTFSAKDIVLQNDNGEKSMLMVTRDHFYRVSIDGDITEIDMSESGISGSYTAMDMLDNQIYIVTSEGIWSSPMEAFTWSKLADVDNADYFFTASDFTEGFAWFGANDGKIVRYSLTDGSSEVLHQSAGRVYEISMGSSNVGYVSAQGESDPLKTNDGGTTWIPQSTWPENNTNIAVYGEDIVVFANTNRYFYSTDGGETVTRVGTNLQDIGLVAHAVFSDEGRLYMTGRANTVLISEDFGATFENINPRSRARLTSIKVGINGNFITSGEQTVITSVDGLAWTPVDLSGTFTQDNYIEEVAVVGADVYAIASDLGIHLLEDGALQQISDVSTSGIFYHETEGYFMALQRGEGQEQNYVKSTDGGSSWELKYTSEKSSYGLVMSEDETLHCRTGFEGKYYISVDHGETWTEKIVPDEAYISDLYINGNIIVYSAGSQLFISQDDGESYEQIASSYAMNNIHIENNTIYYTSASNSNTNIYKKELDEPNFSVEDRLCGSSYDAVVHEGFLYFAKDGGHIDRISVSGIIDAVENPKVDNLEIAPNLVMSGTTISVASNLTDSYEVTVVNGNGMLVDEFQQNLSHFDLDTQGYAKGLYIVCVKSKERTYTGKIIVY